MTKKEFLQHNIYNMPKTFVPVGVRLQVRSTGDFTKLMQIIPLQNTVTNLFVT
ncbi:hypothetical protein IKP85_06160 [bacterium]|nr:hypothetical protein [bacterium]